MKKKVFLVSLLLLSAVFFLTPDVKSRIKPYYKGDAISYNGSVVIGSTNMETIELFKVDSGRIVKTAKIISFRHRYSGYESYYDLKFNKEGDKLYAYAVDGTYLYKYDVSDLSNPILIKQVKDNSWDYFLGLEKRGDNMVTVGTKGIKVWNSDMDSIDLYKVIKSKDYYNVAFSPDGTIIFNIENGEVNVFDTVSRSYTADFKIEEKEAHNRKVYNDGHDNAVYLVDDKGFKMMDFAGKAVKSFNHTSSLGYDVAPSADGNYIYFSDGIGIVKMDKKTFKPVKWAYTTSLGGNGGWAMGLKVVAAGDKEYVVVFNNANILVLNSSLNKVDSYQSSLEETKPEVKEGLYLSLDRTRAAGNSSISLLGGGFGANEPLEITFGDISSAKTTITADANGKLSKILVVPDVKTQRLDIKVVGKTTGLHYSIAFLIE